MKGTTLVSIAVLGAISLGVAPAHAQATFAPWLARGLYSALVGGGAYFAGSATATARERQRHQERAARPRRQSPPPDDFGDDPDDPGVQ